MTLSETLRVQLDRINEAHAKRTQETFDIIDRIKAGEHIEIEPLNERDWRIPFQVRK